jgi:molybdopterin-guanine dinucleotide biosynthesis protein B
VNVLGFAGWNGSGKTWLLTRLIPVLVARGLSVSTIKHAHEEFEIDRPGKDSFEHRAAGAHEVLVSSAKRYALIHELREEPERGLADLLPLLGPADLVLIEGFKHARHSKLEVHRASVGMPLLFEGDDSIRAVVSDTPVATTLPQARPDDLERVADLVLEFALPLDVTLARL